MSLKRIGKALVGASLALTSACLGEAGTDGEEAVSLGSKSEALVDDCVIPPVGSGALCDLGEGTLTFLVTLPSGQAYVELFSRQNGVQNVAANIVANADVHEDGTTTYSFTRSGYALEDRVEYRFYSYLPASPGVFTPGPDEQVWLTNDCAPGKVLEMPVLKDASLIYSSYGLGLVYDQNFGTAPTVDVAGYHEDSFGLFGYPMPSCGAEAVVEKAELVIPSMSAAGGEFDSIRLGIVYESESWDELTVTRQTTPGASFYGEYYVDTTGENRLDLTTVLGAALDRGEREMSFLLQNFWNNLFIDSKEKLGGKPTYLRIQFAN